jgi:hypothetical protein
MYAALMTSANVNMVVSHSRHKHCFKLGPQAWTDDCDMDQAGAHRHVYMSAALSCRSF